MLTVVFGERRQGPQMPGHQEPCPEPPQLERWGTRPGRGRGQGALGWGHPREAQGARAVNGHPMGNVYRCLCSCLQR